MTLDQSQKIIMINLLLEKSDKNMEQAVHNSKSGYWDLVANRLFYSVFHAVNALFMADGIKSVSHKGTTSQFGKFYVLTGKFRKEDGILYSRLQTMREKADYQNVFTLNEEDGLKLIEEAGYLRDKIISKIKEIIY